jgi:transcription initiation factor TFIIE subunit beta
MASKLSAAGQLRPSSSMPSPTPSTGSAPVGTKRKRNGPPAVQPKQQDPKLQREMLSQYSHCVNYLKEQRKEKTFNEIINYLSLGGGADWQISIFERFLQDSSRKSKIRYNPKANTYSYRPTIPATNGDELIAYLDRMQRQKDAIFGAKIDDIRDGWRDVDGGEKLVDTLDRMEQEGKLLISRDKAHKPKMVYMNDRGVFPTKIDDEFRLAWHKFEIDENSDKLRNALEAQGLKAATAPKEIVVAKPKQKKPKGRGRGGRQTNLHMQHILKDYSNRRA